MNKSYKYDIDGALKRFKKICTLEQMRVINYAIYQQKISIEDLEFMVLNNVSGEDMSIYVDLMLLGIDVKQYIKNNWKEENAINDLKNMVESKKKINKKNFNNTLNKDKLDINNATITVIEPKIDINYVTVNETEPKKQKIKVI